MSAGLSFWRKKMLPDSGFRSVINRLAQPEEGWRFKGYRLHNRTVCEFYAFFETGSPDGYDKETCSRMARNAGGQKAEEMQYALLHWPQ